MSHISKLPRGWIAYMAIMLVFNFALFATPLLSMMNFPFTPIIYEAFHYTCHQLDSRSLCIYPAGNGGKLIDDCTLQDGKLYLERNMIVIGAEKYHMKNSSIIEPVGYKIPVCSRDVGIYGFMLLGGIAWIFWAKKNPARLFYWPHPIWLIVALAPLAIDGGMQVIGFWESTNTIRLLTGALAGIAMAFYALPAFCILLDAPKIK
jgi:uncharacterized membrane protein